MSDTEGGRLNSWKQIARHLGRDVRTAMRWEKQAGMPIHRIPGPGDGRSVFAYVSELDAWLTGQEAQAGTTVPESGSGMALGPRWVWVTTWIVAVAGVSAMRLADPRGALHAVASVAATGDIVTANAPDGTPLWAVRHPEGRSFLPRSEIIRMVDLNGSARQMVLLAANTSAERGDDRPFGELLALSASGELLWHRAVDDEIRFGERSFSGPWMSGFLSVVNVDGEDVILWGVHHTTWWPSLVVALTPDGLERGRFVNSGWLSAAASLSSPDGDRILVSGVSNAHRAAMLAVLPGASLRGSSPEEPGSGFECLDCAGGEPLRYLLFPPSHVNQASGLPYNHAVVGLSDEGVTVTVLEGPAGSDAQWFYEFTPELELLHVTPGDSYWTHHAQLETEGKIDHPAAECPERDGLPVRSWTRAGGWVEVRAGG